MKKRIIEIDGIEKEEREREREQREKKREREKERGGESKQFFEQIL